MLLLHHLTESNKKTNEQTMPEMYNHQRESKRMKVSAMVKKTNMTLGYAGVLQVVWGEEI